MRVLLLLAVFLGSLSCATRVPVAEQLGLAVPTRVFLISIDTLRADHLGSYGYERDTSPHLDVFRQEAVLFREVISHAPSTLPAHASILTSLLPQHHLASVAEDTALADEALTLAEVFSAAGFKTVAVTGGGQLDPAYGVDQGFDTYRIPKNNQQFRTVARQTSNWLRKNRDRAFLFLHTYQVHAPYVSPSELLDVLGNDYTGSLPDQIDTSILDAINGGELAIDDEDLAHIVRTYDADIRRMDQQLARFFGWLKGEGLYDDSLIVITSDHGEEFGERGQVGRHSYTLHDELLHVPLLIRFPDGAFGGSEVSSQVRGIDIAPTILEALRLPVPEEFQGTSLLGHLEQTRPSLPAVSSLDKFTARMWSLRDGGWKLYGPALYDLANDPGELEDVAMTQRERYEDLRRTLREQVQAREPLPLNQVTPDEQLIEQLKALGYL